MSLDERGSGLFRVRLERAGAYRCSFGDIELSTAIPVEQADAVVCEYQPTELLYTFRGPAAWYAAEPLARLRARAYRRALGRIQAWQHFNHAHADLRFRVPCYTHYGSPLAMADAAARQPRVVAVVSKRGGPGTDRASELYLRTQLCTHGLVDLYGRRKGWRSYRSTWTSWPHPPKNYRGPLPGDWDGVHKLALLAQYHSVICLENTFEPYYFTEKWVDVARAGCVPIYHAHPTVRTTFLAGARWVDPADFGFDPERTLRFALAEDRLRYAEANRAWLKSDAIARTSWPAVFERICRTLRDIAEGRLAPS